MTTETSGEKAGSDHWAGHRKVKSSGNSCGGATLDFKPNAHLGRRLAVNDEHNLVARLRAGDSDSYEHLVRTYGGRMLAVARRLVRNEDDAQDCVQEAFLKAFQKLDGFEGRAALGTWLHRVVVNEALGRIRARNRRPEVFIEDLLPTFDTDGSRVEPDHRRSDSAETHFESAETAQLVRESIDRLPDTYRNVIIMRDIEGHDTEETAVLLDIAPGAVKTRLHRARAALKTLLELAMSGEKP